MNTTRHSSARAAARIALIAAAVSSPIVTGAPRTSVQGAPAALAAPAVAPADPYTPPVGPSRPPQPPPAIRRPVIVRVRAGREAGAIAAAVGVAADAGGRDRRAGRPSVWRALLNAGSIDLAPLDAVLASLEATGHASDIERFPIAHAVAVAADDAAIARLRAEPSVVDVAPEHVHHLAEHPSENQAAHIAEPIAPIADPIAADAATRSRSIRTAAPSVGPALRLRPLSAVLDPAPGAAGRLEAVGAPSAWRRGIDGAGVVVAIFDAGVDWLHPALMNRYRGRDGDHNYDWMDFVDALKRPRDVLGHGTGVAGLAVGVDASGALGVAPGAEWIAVRAFDAQGAAGDRNLLRGGEWLMAPTNLDLRAPRPELAPDVVNASWTLENGVDPLFEPILAAWRALGITAVFAAGNDDTDIGAVGAARKPAAAADAIAVGAVDDAGRIWRLSLGGPTWDDRIKPDVLAPGVEVLTAGIDGSYDRKDGTSMAAPQVSGAAALLLSAQPDLTPDDIARFLRQSAIDGGAAGPDPVYGYGRLAADRAVDAAADAGRVAGHVHGPDGPVPFARVTLSAGSRWASTTDREGAFSLAVPAGGWTLSVRALGWRLAPGAPTTVGVVDDGTTALELEVVPDAPITQTGTVVDAWGAPLSGARIEAIDPDPDRSAAVLAAEPHAGTAGAPPAADAPIATLSDAAGRFTLHVPPDVTTVRVRATGHQAVTRTLAASGPLSVTLRTAPRILVVDADAWMGDGQRVWPYTVRALSDAGYRLGDSVAVRALAEPGGPGSPAGGALPKAAESSPYDIVVWSHLYGSPGSLDRARGDHSATDWLRAWVAGGRRLLVTGQDIGQWDSMDGASSARLAPTFFRDVLGAQFIGGDAGTAGIEGHGPLDGVRLESGWRRGYPKADRLKPDIVAPAVAAAAAIADYRGGGAAAIAVDGPPSRRAYLAFGPESAGDRAALGRLFDRLIDWLGPIGLQLDASPALVRPGGAVRLRVAVDGGAHARDAALRLDRPLWLEVADADLPPDWRRADDGALTWSGTLPAGTPSRWTLSATVHPAAAGHQPVTLTLTSAASVITSTTAVEVAAARLARASTVAVSPARLAVPGPVRVVLRVVNDGTAAAIDPFVRIGQLPNGLHPITSTLRASAGRAEWLPDAQDGLRWSGNIPPHSEVIVAFDAVVDAAAGDEARVRATVDSGDADRAELDGGVRIGGPVVQLAAPVRSAPPVLIAGRAALITIPLVNAGRAPAELVIQAVLPPGLEPSERPAGRWDAATRTLTLTAVVPPGAALPLTFPILVDADATIGARAIRVRVDDGLLPADVLEAEFATEVRRFDLRPSRLVVSPAIVGSGTPASVTLFAGNFGDAAVDVHATLGLPSSLALVPRSVRASAGQVQADVGGLEWDVRIPPAVEDYSAQTEAPNTAWPPPVRGEPIAPADGAGRRPPVSLGLPFPYYAEIITRTWVTDDGLVAFSAPVARPDPALGPAAAGVPAIALLWRPGRSLGMPRIVRSADAWTVVWSTPERSVPIAALSMRMDGDIWLWVAADAPVDGAITGLNAADGRTLTLATAEIAGTSVHLGSPGGWARLSLDAVPSTSLTPNTLLHVKATLAADGSPETVVEASALGNRLTFDPSELSLSTDAPGPGGAVTAELTIATDGPVAARNAQARIQVSSAADIDPATLPPELQLVEGELLWKGRIEPHEPVTLSWPMKVRPDVPPGTRLVVLVRLQADGMARTERRAAATIRSGPPPTVQKRPSISAALAGERIGWVLRAENPGPMTTRMTLVDAMPAALAIAPESVTASLGPGPTWDPVARRLGWSGDVPSGMAVEVRFATRFEGLVGERVANALVVTTDDGARLTTSADVVGAGGRCYLPLVFGRR
ncbi:MAG: S8 family serine peptidase [Ardenticatenales bacterium]